MSNNQPEESWQDAADNLQEQASQEDVQTPPSSSIEMDEEASEVDSLKQQLLRVHADFDNFRRRTRQEKEDLQRFANRKLLTDLLPVADNFERALDAMQGATDEVKTGVDMIHRQLQSILQQHGVAEIVAAGQPFDPTVHDAVMQEPSEGMEPGLVSAVLQKGYIVHGKVIRPAMVKVTV